MKGLVLAGGEVVLIVAVAAYGAEIGRIEVEERFWGIVLLDYLGVILVEDNYILYPGADGIPIITPERDPFVRASGEGEAGSNDPVPGAANEIIIFGCLLWI